MIQYGLIGVSNNISQHIDKIKRWSSSFKHHVPEGKVVLLAADTTEEDINSLEENNIDYFEVDTDKRITVNDSRILATSEYLKNCNIDRVMVTDVFDVVFQNNPFAKCDWNTYDFYIGSEGIKHNEEPWNSDVMNKTFPQFVDITREEMVKCSGVICGTRGILIDVFEQMYFLVESALNGHDIRDQAALNILLAQNRIPNVRVFDLDEGWVVHAACSGPTFQNLNWGFKELLTKRFGLPKLTSSKVVTQTNAEYDIVHQFNRIPEWEKLIIEQYG